MTELRRGRTTPFTMVPDTFFALRGFTASEKLVYLYLYYRASRTDRTAFPSYRTMAHELDLTRSTVIHAISRLVDRALLQKETRKTTAGDFTSNWYVIWEPEDASKVGSIKIESPPDMGSTEIRLPMEGSTEIEPPSDAGGAEIGPPRQCIEKSDHGGLKIGPQVVRKSDHPLEKNDLETQAPSALAGSPADPNQMYLEPDPLNQRVGDVRGPARARVREDIEPPHPAESVDASLPGPERPMPPASSAMDAPPTDSPADIPPLAVLDTVAAALDCVILGSRDVTAIRECWAYAAGDFDRFVAILEAARAQFQPQFPDDRIRTAQYFVPAFARDAAIRTALTAPGTPAPRSSAKAIPAGVDPETGLDADGNSVIDYTPYNGINLSKRNTAFLQAWLRKHQAASSGGVQ